MKNEGGVSSVETKRGSNGSATIATLIAGAPIPVSGEEILGPTTSIVKGAGRETRGKKKVSITVGKASTEEVHEVERKAVNGAGKGGRGK